MIQTIKKAINYRYKGCIRSAKYNARLTMFWCASCLSDTYDAFGNVDSAYKYLVIASDLDDTLESKDKSVLIAQKQSEFEYQQKSIADSVKKIEEKKVFDAIVAKEKAEKKTGNSKSMVFNRRTYSAWGISIHNLYQVKNYKKAK